LELAEILEAVHGRGTSYRERPSLSGEPDGVLETLLVTILSQASSDGRTRKIWDRLTEQFPTPGAMLQARPGEIEEILRPGGLAKQKASYIQQVIARVCADMGECSLERLRSWTDGECRDYLLDLPGVGIKTAACVLLFGLDRDVFPVDTHVARIARRLGLVSEGAAPERIHRDLAPHIPPGIALSLHLNLLEHGRKVCLAVSPKCGMCDLQKWCCWYGEDGNREAR